MRFDWTLVEADQYGRLFSCICCFMVGPLAYIGGKNRLAKQIIALFPKHKTYVEPFAGGAQVFFHKEPAAVEVLNDLDEDIFNFFRVCQVHHEELLRHLRFSLVSRKWFEWLKAQNPESLTDIQRAVRFFYLQKNCFAGLVRNPNYHYHVSRPPGFNLERLPQLIENAHKRLERVQIECLPYEQILERYDRPATLFYLDPPYWNRRLYRYNFTREDFVKLEERVRSLRGRETSHDRKSDISFAPVELAHQCPERSMSDAQCAAAVPS